MIDIVFENNNLIIVHKKPGIAVQTARLGEKDLVNEVLNYLKKNGNNNPYAAVINRLDQPVEGIVLFAKNKNSAASLSKQLKDGAIEKYYYAYVQGKMEYNAGTMVDFCIKDEKTNTSKVASDDTPGAKKAVLEFKVVKYIEKTDCSLVEIHLITGRHHQIRVQMSASKHPLIGDRKYGGDIVCQIANDLNINSICLCAYKMIFTEPKTDERITVIIDKGPDWIYA